MYKSYFKIGWRNLTRHKMYSVINIGGFSIGIAACLLISLFIKNELNYDRYPDANRIYRVINVWNDSGDTRRSVWFQAPFASALKEDYAEIEMTGRYHYFFGEGGKQFRLADKSENTYEQGFVFMDQELLQILNLPMVHGSIANCLDDPRTLVISQRKSEKYFSGENPVGRLVILDNDSIPYKIGGVIENFPTNSHLQFDFLITLKDVEFWPGEQTDWDGNNYATYVKLREGANPSDLEEKLKRVVSKYMLPLWIKNGASDPKALSMAASFELQPLRDIYLRSDGIQDSSVSYGDIQFVWLFGVIACFILVIGCINFVNLSTAKSANRAKEVGLRKTAGSHRGNIIIQFLAESVLFSFLSFAVGLLLAYGLLPYFNLLAAKAIEFPWNDWFAPYLNCCCDSCWHPGRALPCLLPFIICSNPSIER